MKGCKKHSVIRRYISSRGVTHVIIIYHYWNLVLLFVYFCCRLERSGSSPSAMLHYILRSFLHEFYLPWGATFCFCRISLHGLKVRRQKWPHPAVTSTYLWSAPDILRDKFTNRVYELLRTVKLMRKSKLENVALQLQIQDKTSKVRVNLISRRWDAHGPWAKESRPFSLPHATRYHPSPTSQPFSFTMLPTLLIRHQKRKDPALSHPTFLPHTKQYRSQ